MVKSADVVIVGGGIIGLMSAYFLSKAGVDVLIIERHACGSGQSTRTGGGLRWHHASKLNMDLMKLSNSTWEELIPQLDYKQTGHLFLTNDINTQERFKTEVKQARNNQIESSLLTQSELTSRWSDRSLQFKSGIYCGLGGFLSDHELINLMVDKLLNLGVKIESGLLVEDILLNDSKAYGLRTNEGDYHADYVVNAAGAYAGKLAKTCGYPLPVISRRHELLIAHVPSGYKPFPWLIDVDCEVHMRPNTADTVLLGGFLGQDVAVEPEDYKKENDKEWVGNVIQAANRSFHFEIMEKDVIVGWAGLYPGTPDYHPIVEMSLPGLVTAGGFAGTGLMHSPAAGMIVCDLIAAGKTDLLNIEMLDSARFVDSDETQYGSGF